MFTEIPPVPGDEFDTLSANQTLSPSVAKVIGLIVLAVVGAFVGAVIAVFTFLSISD